MNNNLLKQGDHFPQVTLNDGTVVQTGTVANMLRNIERYNAGERGAVEDQLKLAVPTLIKVGLFNLFSVDEWLQGNNAGRKFVAREAQIYFK